jgi:hypothetical protein
MPSECELCASLDEPGNPLCEDCGECLLYDCVCERRDPDDFIPQDEY